MSEYNITWVDVNAIHGDRDNPNGMSEQEFNALVSEIKTYGLIQPIVIRKCNCNLIAKEHRIIIGGEHRWLAAKDPEIAMKRVPCIDLDLNDEEAKLLMVNLNRIHGKHIPLKLASLIVDLNRKIPTEELQKRLYVSKQDLIEIMYPRAAETIKINSSPINDNGKDRPRETLLFSLVLTKEQYQKATEVLKAVMKDEKCNRAEALTLICERYKGDRTGN